MTEKKSLIIVKELLTDFPQDNCKYFFYHVLDQNTDHVISMEDFNNLNERVTNYMDWSVNTIQFLSFERSSWTLSRQLSFKM